ncbi:hypothetical protein NONS58_03680 [Nitrosococcus oceani]|nr:hypothetical protein NONS58_03680 [Nitrosococcus oceani]
MDIGAALNIQHQGILKLKAEGLSVLMEAYVNPVGRRWLPRKWEAPSEWRSAVTQDNVW